MIETFPVVAVRRAAPERSRSGRQCPHTRYTYVDGHLHERAGGRIHEAQDIFAPSGSKVLAPEPGVILMTAKTRKGGHLLRMYAPGSNRTYLMSHLLKRPEVRAGDQVLSGQLLAYVGRSGNAAGTCPHLHIRAAVGRDRRRGDRWVRGRALNIYRELLASDPTRTGGARRKPPTRVPTGCPCPDCPRLRETTEPTTEERAAE